jgi:hypothetical protein
MDPTQSGDDIIANGRGDDIVRAHVSGQDHGQAQTGKAGLRKLARQI